MESGDYTRWALAAEPATDGLQLFDVIADHFDYGGYRNRQQPDHRAPQETEEEEGYGQCQCVEADAPAHQRGNQQVVGDEVKQREDGEDADKGAGSVELFDADQDRRHPGKHHAQIRNQIQQAGKQTEQEGKIQSHAPEEKPTEDDQNQADERGTDHVAAQYHGDVRQSFFYFGAARGGK